MRVLCVDLEREWRGGQNQALLLLKDLHARGHAAELLALENSPLAERARGCGVTVHTVPARHSTLRAFFLLRRIFAQGVPEIVHANEPQALTAAWLAKAHRRTSLVISRRVGYPLSRFWLAKARYRAARRIIANSQWVAGKVAACGIPPLQIAVIHEGAEIPPPPSAEQRRQARARWGLAAGIPLLGCAGVFLADKGQEWLIRALAALRPEFPQMRLLLAGDGPLRGQLEALARELGVADAVLFPGFVKDVENVYAAVDVYLLPSFFEALNNSLLAAMACEAPCIAFAKGALPEIIEHESSGLLVSGPDVAEIREAVARLLRDPALAGKLGRAGRARVQQNFSADAMVEKTLWLYRVIRGTAGDARPV
ncbi:MAG: glycosyltransferase family 4 protein [Acidobacteriia bacterium]|nr:glycosyltransferase family 4 protein [Terriglobia bacterium]